MTNPNPDEVNLGGEVNPSPCSHEGGRVWRVARWDPTAPGEVEYFSDGPGGREWTTDPATASLFHKGWAQTFAHGQSTDDRWHRYDVQRVPEPDTLTERPDAYHVALLAEVDGDWQWWTRLDPAWTTDRADCSGLPLDAARAIADHAGPGEVRAVVHAEDPSPPLPIEDPDDEGIVQAEVIPVGREVIERDPNNGAFGIAEAERTAALADYWAHAIDHEALLRAREVLERARAACRVLATSTYPKAFGGPTRKALATDTATNLRGVLSDLTTGPARDEPSEFQRAWNRLTSAEQETIPPKWRPDADRFGHLLEDRAR